MKNRSKNKSKSRKNQDHWIYGYHAVIAALKNENRIKYRLVVDEGAKKKLDKEPDFFLPKALTPAIKEKNEIEKKTASPNPQPQPSAQLRHRESGKAWLEHCQ